MNYKKDDVSKNLVIGIFYQHIDDLGGYPRDVQRLYQELGNYYGKAYKIRNMLALVKAGRRLDVVHIFGVFMVSSSLAALYCKVMNIPYVITTFGQLMPFALSKGSRKKRFYLSLIGRHMLNSANKLHAFTQYEEVELRKLGVKVPIEKITLGVYPEDIDRTNYPIKDKIISRYSPYIIFLGRLDILQKGLDILIEGFVKYSTQSSNYQLLICGQDWKGGHDFIKLKLAELENPNRISFLGAVSEEEKNELIENSEAFIYPSRFDGPPRPLRSALSKNIKVLASYQSNIADNLEDKAWGLLFDANANAISDVLLRFEKKKNWPSYKDPNIELAWDKLVKDYISMYETLVTE